MGTPHSADNGNEKYSHCQKNGAQHGIEFRAVDYFKTGELILSELWKYITESTHRIWVKSEETSFPGL